MFNGNQAKAKTITIENNKKFVRRYRSAFDLKIKILWGNFI